MIILDVRNLEPYTSFQSPVLSAIVEAASVMLSRFRGQPPTPGTWKRDGEAEDVSLLWEQSSADAQAAQANEKDATEDGAYAVAIAAADHLGFRVVGRVHQGSGADWVMVPKGEPTNDYYKLEVSGIARINAEKPESRLRSKVDQGQGGDFNRPGIAAVARFEDALILTEAWR